MKAIYYAIRHVAGGKYCESTDGRPRLWNTLELASDYKEQYYAYPSTWQVVPVEAEIPEPPKPIRWEGEVWCRVDHAGILLSYDGIPSPFGQKLGGMRKFRAVFEEVPE